MGKKRTSVIWLVPDDEFIKMCKEANSLAEVLRHLYDGHLNSALYKILKKRIAEDGIDISHIDLGVGNRKGKTPVGAYTKETFLESLTDDKLYHSGIKDRLIKFDVIPHDCCSVCSQSRMWNGSTLSLQIDHIDGNCKNNLITNLRFICPNCHTQTKTFCIGNRKSRKLSKTKCQSCDELITRSSTHCMSCASTIVNKPKRRFDPTYDELFKVVCVDRIPFTTLGEQYGVSDNAVRKRCIRLGIDPKNREKFTFQ
jgi:hypothetical protein